MKLLLCAFIIICAAVFCGNCFAEDTWTINTVAYGISGPPSVTVDINNNPVMAFTSNPYSYSYLYTATQTDTGYQVEKVQVRSPAVWPRIATTSNNELAMTFNEIRGFCYASKGSWFDWAFSYPQIQIGVLDLALTDNDIPHTVSIRSPGYVEHAFFDVHSQQWAKETLSGFGQLMSGYAKIDIDSSGKILVCCFDNSKGKTLCAVSSNGFWNYLPVINSAIYPDCSFTADGLPSVAYIKSNQICYAVYVNDIIGWVETQIAYCSSNSWVSLGHSSTGIPGISYFSNNKLMYATNIAGGWTTTEIDVVGTSSYSDLIFDKNDKPLIVYNGIDARLGNLPMIKLAGIGLASLKTGFDVSGTVTDRLTGFPVENVTVRWHGQTFSRDVTTTTDANGFYQFADMPPAIIDVYASADSYATASALNLAFDNDINNLDFALMPYATLSGKVLDNITAQPIPNVTIEYNNDKYQNWVTVVSDANGNFCLTNLWPGTAEVKAEPDVNSGYAWNLPWGSDFVNLKEGEHRTNIIIFLEKGSLVHGYIKDANENPLANFEFSGSGRNCEVWSSTDANGFYQIRLPKGTFTIMPDDDYVFGSLNKIFTVTDGNSDVNLSDIIVYTSTTGKHISGDVNNPEGYAKNGTFEIYAFKAGTNLNDANLYYATTSVAYLGMDNAGAFSFDNLPSDVNYDIYLMAYSQLDERDSQTIRSIAKDVALDTNNVYLEYNSAGSDINGCVKNINGIPVLGATALLFNSLGDFKGYCETDSNGLYTIYNVPVGDYTITAIHSKYANASTLVDVNDGIDANAGDIIMPFDGSKEGPDLNGNGIVDLFDIAELTSQWLEAGINEADFNQDSIVNFFDWLPIADNWLYKAIWLAQPVE